MQYFVPFFAEFLGKMCFIGMWKVRRKISPTSGEIGGVQGSKRGVKGKFRCSEVGTGNSVVQWAVFMHALCLGCTLRLGSKLVW
jgi:hypothetical protein